MRRNLRRLRSQISSHKLSTNTQNEMCIEREMRKMLYEFMVFCSFVPTIVRTNYFPLKSVKSARLCASQALGRPAARARSRTWGKKGSRFKSERGADVLYADTAELP